MKKTEKDRIVRAVRKYLDEKQLSQAKLAKIAQVNASYLSNILNGNYSYSAGDRTIEIGDNHFLNLAKAVDFTKEEETFWEIRNTDQYLTVTAHLLACHQCAFKDFGGFKMILGDTGTGKTTGVNKYCKENPATVIRVTVNNLDRIYELLVEIAHQLAVPLPKRHGSWLRAITQELVRRSQLGEKMLLIIDEGENTTLSGIRAYKAIMDAVKGYAAFAILGTRGLLKQIERWAESGREGIPQFQRRIKANMVFLDPIDKERDFAVFLEQVEDTDLRKLLMNLCNNYGELNDYLEPALRKSHELGVPLTEDFFRVMYNMPEKKRVNH